MRNPYLDLVDNFTSYSFVSRYTIFLVVIKTMKIFCQELF